MKSKWAEKHAKLIINAAVSVDGDRFVYTDCTLTLCVALQKANVKITFAHMCHDVSMVALKASESYYLVFKCCHNTYIVKCDLHGNPHLKYIITHQEDYDHWRKVNYSPLHLASQQGTTTKMIDECAKDPEQVNNCCAAHLMCVVAEALQQANIEIIAPMLSGCNVRTMVDPADDESSYIVCTMGYTKYYVHDKYEQKPVLIASKCLR